MVRVIVTTLYSKSSDDFQCELKVGNKVFSATVQVKTHAANATVTDKTRVEQGIWEKAKNIPRNNRDLTL